MCVGAESDIILQSLENPMQQQKRKTVVTNRATKVKGKVQKSKKTVATKVCTVS